MSKRKSVDLRTFVTNVIAGLPSKSRRKPETRLQVIHQAVEAATRGTVRKLDGTLYTGDSARVFSRNLYNEIVGM